MQNTDSLKGTAFGIFMIALVLLPFGIMDYSYYLIVGDCKIHYTNFFPMAVWFLLVAISVFIASCKKMDSYKTRLKFISISILVSTVILATIIAVLNIPTVKSKIVTLAFRYGPFPSDNPNFRSIMLCKDATDIKLLSIKDLRFVYNKNVRDLEAVQIEKDRKYAINNCTCIFAKELKRLKAEGVKLDLEKLASKVRETYFKERTFRTKVDFLFGGVSYLLCIFILFFLRAPEK